MDIAAMTLCLLGIFGIGGLCIGFACDMFSDDPIGAILMFIIGVALIILFAYFLFMVIK